MNMIITSTSYFIFHSILLIWALAVIIVISGCSREEISVHETVYEISGTESAELVEFSDSNYVAPNGHLFRLVRIRVKSYPGIDHISPGSWRLFPYLTAGPSGARFNSLEEFKVVFSRDDSEEIQTDYVLVFEPSPIDLTEFMLHVESNDPISVEF